MTIISELHQDHVNLNKLLMILRQKVVKLREGQHPNFNLMADVINYIANYADGFHHPREDKLYEYLSSRDSLLDEKLQKCVEDHLTLKHASLHLQEKIDGILHDAVLPMQEFANLLEEYVLCQTEHLNFEEGEIFPLIEKLVSEAEMTKLEAQLPMPEDPLFGEKRAQEYMELYRELILDLNDED